MLLAAVGARLVVPEGHCQQDTATIPDFTPERLYGEIEPACACESLTDLSLPNTIIQSAAIDPTDGSCRVTAVVTRPPAEENPITVWIGLPVSGWNGRFRGTGGRGFEGGSPSSLGKLIAAGYAAAATDTGNTGTTGAFALDENERLNWQAIQNHAYEGIHEMTVTGKALTEAYYGRPAGYSYFAAGSSGGRQALAEAQRFPEDYDGIVARCPGINLHYLFPSWLWAQMVMQEANNFLPESKLDAATAAAVAACDARDGVEDGIIDDPIGCDFDPAALVGTLVEESEFTAVDAEVVRKIWEGPRSPDGSMTWYGLPRGADLWVSRSEGDPLVGKPMPLALDYIGLFIKQDPEWDWRTLTPEGFEHVWRQSKEQYEAVFGTNAPDLTRFRDHGGKIMIVHGLADQFIPPENIIDYYERVQLHMGGPEKTAGFARLFLAPGVGHGMRTAGTTPDWLDSAIIRWVEEDAAPDRLEVAFKDDDGNVVRTRPLFPYPRKAVYRGAGNPDEASSFRSELPIK